MGNFSDIANRNTQVGRQGWNVASTSIKGYEDGGTLTFSPAVAKLLETTGKNLRIAQMQDLSKSIRDNIGGAPAFERHTTLAEANVFKDCIYKFCGIQPNGTHIEGDVYPTDEQHHILNFQARQERGMPERSIHRDLGNFTNVIEHPNTPREQEQHRTFFNSVLKEIGTSKVLQDISARCPDVLDCGNSKDPDKLAEYKAYKNEVSRIFFEAASKVETEPTEPVDPHPDPVDPHPDPVDPHPDPVDPKKDPPTNKKKISFSPVVSTDIPPTEFSSTPTETSLGGGTGNTTNNYGNTINIHKDGNTINIHKDGDTIHNHGNTINNFGPITINFPGGNSVQGPNNTPPPAQNNTPAKTNIFSGPEIRLDRPKLQEHARAALGNLPKDVQRQLCGDSNPEDPILAFAEKNIAGFATMHDDVKKRVLNAIAADVLSISKSSNPEGLNLQNLDPQILKTSMLGVAEKAKVMKDYAVVQVVNQPPPAGQENSAALLPNMYATMLKQFPEGQRTAALCAAKLLEDTIKDLSSEADKDFIRKMFNNEKSAKALKDALSDDNVDVLDIVKNMQAGLWQAAKNEDDDALKQLELNVAGNLRMKYQFSVTNAQEVNLYIPQEGETLPNDVTSLIDTLPLPENTRKEIKNALNEFQAELSKFSTPEIMEKLAQILESANGNFDETTMNQLQQTLAPLMPSAERLTTLLGSSSTDPKVQQQFIQSAMSSLPPDVQQLMQPLMQPLMQFFTQNAATTTQVQSTNNASTQPANTQELNAEAKQRAIFRRACRDVEKIANQYLSRKFTDKKGLSTQDCIAAFLSEVKKSVPDEETLNAVISLIPYGSSDILSSLGHTIAVTITEIARHTIPKEEQSKTSMGDVLGKLDDASKRMAIDILTKNPANLHPELTEEALKFAYIAKNPDRKELINHCKQLHKEGKLDRKKLDALTNTMGLLEGRVTRGYIPSGTSIRNTIMNNSYFRFHKLKDEIKTQPFSQSLAKLPSKLRKEVNKELTKLQQALGGDYSLESIDKLFENVDNCIETAKMDNETTKDAGERLEKTVQTMTLPVYKFVQRINELLPAADSQIQKSPNNSKAKKLLEERKNQDMQQVRAKLLEPIMTRVENDAKKMQQLTNMFKEGIDSQKIYTNHFVQKFCQEHGAMNVFDIQIMSPDAAKNIKNLQRIENGEYDGMPLYANFNTNPMQVVIVSDDTTPRTFDALVGPYSVKNLPQGKGSEPHEFIGNFLTSVKDRAEVHSSLRENIHLAETNNSFPLLSVIRETNLYIGIANRGPLMEQQGATQFSFALRNIMHRAKSSEGQRSLATTLKDVGDELTNTAITIFKQDIKHNPHPELTEKALEFAYAPNREALGQYCKTLGDEQADQLLETIAYLESGKENVSSDAIKEGKEGILVAMLEQDKANPNPALTKEALDMFSETDQDKFNNKFNNYSATHSPEEVKQFSDTMNYIANYTNKSR